MSGAIEKFDALHQLQSKSRLRIDLGLRFGSTDHRSRKHNGSCIGSSFCQAQLGRILTRFDGRQPLLARDWRVQLRRLRSSRIPGSPQELELERICHNLGGVSSKSHEAPGTYPESLVDRFQSSLFCRSDSNCLLLDNCVVEETSPSPESVGRLVAAEMRPQ